MQDDKQQTDRKTVNPVIDQKIIKSRRYGWLIYLLSALLALILISLFIHHNKKETYSTPPATESSRSVTTDKSVTANNKQFSDTSDTARDKLNAWFAGDKNKDSEWIALDHISFDSGSATPVMDDTDQLQEIADILNKNPDRKALVRGFADASGPQSLNDNLSTERANSVRDWLIKHNVKPERISVDGQGASEPVASNTTEQGREMNRRVALKIVAGKAGE